MGKLLFRKRERNLAASEGELVSGIRKYGERQPDGTDQRLRDVKSSRTLLNS